MAHSSSLLLVESFVSDGDRRCKLCQGRTENSVVIEVEVCHSTCTGRIKVGAADRFSREVKRRKDENRMFSFSEKEIQELSKFHRERFLGAVSHGGR